MVTRTLPSSKAPFTTAFTYPPASQARGYTGGIDDVQLETVYGGTLTNARIYALRCNPDVFYPAIAACITSGVHTPGVVHASPRTGVVNARLLFWIAGVLANDDQLWGGPRFEERFVTVVAGDRHGHGRLAGNVHMLLAASRCCLPRRRNERSDDERCEDHQEVPAIPVRGSTTIAGPHAHPRAPLRASRRSAPRPPSESCGARAAGPGSACPAGTRRPTECTATSSRHRSRGCRGSARVGAPRARSSRCSSRRGSAGCRRRSGRRRGCCRG